MRLPSRHDQPLEPLEMNEEDALNFRIAIASGYGGQADWMKGCRCGHMEPKHGDFGCAIAGCGCRIFVAGAHEFLDLWLHPDSIHYLPEDVVVYAHGRRYNHEGLLQFRLKRDVDSSLVSVVRSGVKKETTIYTSPPEGAQT